MEHGSEAGLADQAKSIIQTLAGDPDALAMAARTLGEAAGKTVLMVERNVFGSVDPDELNQVAAVLSVTLGVGVIMIPDHTTGLMYKVAEVLEPVLDAHNAEVAARRRVLVQEARRMGHLVAVVHLRLPQWEGDTLHPAARGGVTVATLVARDGRAVIGGSFCIPGDHFAKRVGANLAVERALAQLADPTNAPYSTHLVTSPLVGDSPEEFTAAAKALTRRMLEWTFSAPSLPSHEAPFRSWLPWGDDWYRRATGADYKAGCLEGLPVSPHRTRWINWGGLDVFAEHLQDTAKTMLAMLDLASAEESPDADGNGGSTPAVPSGEPGDTG